MTDNPLYGIKDKLTGKVVSVGSKEEVDKQLNEMTTLAVIKENYDLIKEILRKYIVMREEYYDIIPLWIIGTYSHSTFESFPYLYLNAMRGSAKSRTLRLVCHLSREGQVMASPTEAVLFRTNGCLGIDEFEGVGGKDKTAVRELLNASYKKGIKVMRMKKKKTIQGEEQVVEEFDVYRPIAMANIWGMEEVLGDRCIQLTLEKSNDIFKTRLMEDYETNESIKKIKENFKRCMSCMNVGKKNIYSTWNEYLEHRHIHTLHTHTTLPTLPTQYTPLHIKQDEMFNKIHDSNIIGRNLELFLPLFMISNDISNECLKNTIKVAKKLINEKKGDEEVESRDVLVYDFVSRQELGNLEYKYIKSLTDEFKMFIDDDDDWCNPRWFGAALKRLNLVVDKRRVSRGIEVFLNVGKAKEKFKIFKKDVLDEKENEN